MMHRAIASALLAVLLILPAAAWDTKEFEGKGKGDKVKWQSAYIYASKAIAMSAEATSMNKCQTGH